MLDAEWHVVVVTAKRRGTRNSVWKRGSHDLIQGIHRLSVVILSLFSFSLWEKNEGLLFITFLWWSWQLSLNFPFFRLFSPFVFSRNIKWKFPCDSTWLDFKILFFFLSKCVKFFTFIKTIFSNLIFFPRRGGRVLKFWHKYCQEETKDIFSLFSQLFPFFFHCDWKNLKSVFLEKLKKEK